MIEAIGTNVTLRPVAVDATTAGGVIIPDEHLDRAKYKVARGEVVSMGSQAFRLSGELINDAPKLGDIVIFPTYEGSLEKSGGEEFRVIADDHIKGVVRNG